MVETTSLMAVQHIQRPPDPGRSHAGALLPWASLRLSKALAARPMLPYVLGGPLGSCPSGFSPDHSCTSRLRELARRNGWFSSAQSCPFISALLCGGLTGSAIL